MSPEFTELLSRQIGNAFAKQLAFADVLGERNWGVSISEGRATFGDDLSYPIQLIGTEADGDSSWLWAWANEQSHLPPPLLRTCSELKVVGERQNIPELCERSFSLEIASGHMIAMIASGLNPGCCYYRGPYDGGALFFLVCNAPSEVTRHVSIERAMTTLTEVISGFEIDHRIMCDSFLRSQGFKLEVNDRTVVATRSGQSLEVSFDLQNRIDKIQGALSRSESTNKRW